MKLKGLIIACLILAILTIGAVSASEDIADNVTLSDVNADDAIMNEAASESSEDVVSQAIDDANEDDLSYSDDESLIKAIDEPEDVFGDYNSGGVEISINNYVDLTDKYAELGHVYDKHGIKGTVSVKIDGKTVFSKKYTSGKTDSIYFNSKTIDMKKFGYGYHTVKITYNDGKAKSDSRKVNFVAIPTISYPSSMSVGEKNGIIIQGEAGMSGTATIFNRIITGYDKYKNPVYTKGNAIKTVKITNGYGWIPLDSLPKGSQSIQLEYKIGTFEDVQTYDIDVKENTNGFKSSISKTTITYGKSITVQLTGPKGTGDADIYIDNDYFKSVRFNFGKMKEVISGLKAGKHRITVKYSDYDSTSFYSKTYTVTVNHAIKLKLPKVKVKKSAKKLVVKATLKIDGKAAKNKKLTFKFNGKVYNAKTDKKGVAKITIKKSILKKLKKGKTIRYEVSYGKNKVIQKVKVKK